MTIGLLSYRKEIDFKWFPILFVLTLFIIIFTFFAPLSYSTLYRTTALYNFMARIVITVSVKTQIIMTISFIIDLLFGISFLFVFPKIYQGKKLYLIIMSLFIFVIFYSCIYSFYFERNWYKYFFSGNWKYNPDSIGSIFGDKQQWGVFLATCFPICFLMIYFLSKTDLKKQLKILFICFISTTALMSFICSLVSFCKTAIICNLIFILIFTIALFINGLIKKKNQKLSFVILGLFLIVLFVFILFRTIPSLKSSKIGLIIDTIIKTLQSSGETGSISRLAIFLSFLERVPATNLMFGFPKGSLEAFELSANPEFINTLHTGIAIFFGRTGLVGITIYFILYFRVVKAIFSIGKKDFIRAGILFGFLAVSFVLDLSELEILIMSSSALVFVKNLVLVSMPLSEYCERRNDYETLYVCIDC